MTDLARHFWRLHRSRLVASLLRLEAEIGTLGPMATLDDAQAQAFTLANPSAVYNPSAAITKKWLALKSQGIYIGVPIGPELPLDDGTATQSFTSGVVLHWKGGDDVEVI